MIGFIVSRVANGWVVRPYERLDSYLDWADVRIASDITGVAEQLGAALAEQQPECRAIPGVVKMSLDDVIGRTEKPIAPIIDG